MGLFNNLTGKIVIVMKNLVKNGDPEQIKEFLDSVDSQLETKEFQDMLNNMEPEDRADFYKFLYELKNKTTYVTNSKANVDPIYNKVSWAPAASGGQNFKSHNLVEVSYDKMQFKGSFMQKLFGLIFMGFGMIPGFIYFSSNDAPIFLLIFPLVFGGVGVFVFLKSFETIIFDKSFGYYYRGKKQVIYDKSKENKKFTRLSNIHALQVLKEHCTSSSSNGRSSSYNSFEINLVLKDGSRINVVDHGNGGRIERDVNTLSKFLNVPVWDYLDR